ncbi:MAG: hypothetical protein R3E79_29405 [Caldilineaceae bacterium]
MIAPTLLESIQVLSVPDKLALIEAISQMLQNELHNRTYANGIVKPPVLSPEPSIETKGQGIQLLIREALSRPKPKPNQMLRCGMFQGRIPTDEDLFKAAEWHPSDEELAGV